MKKETKSLVLYILAMAVFGSIGVFRRFISLSSPMLCAFRGIIGALFIALFLLISGKKVFSVKGKKTVFILILSGLLITLNWVLLFEAYNYTTVPVATLAYYMEPTMFIIASLFIFREKLTVKNALCTLGSLFGMVLVSGVLEGGITGIFGIALGLMSALVYTVIIIINKLLPEVDPYGKTFIQLLSAGIGIIPYILLTENVAAVTPDTRDVILTLVVSVVHTGICYTVYFSVIKNLSPVTLSVFAYCDPVMSIILSALFLGETLSIVAVLGSVLIIGCAVASEVKFFRIKPDK